MVVVLGLIHVVSFGLLFFFILFQIQFLDLSLDLILHTQIHSQLAPCAAPINQWRLESHMLVVLSSQGVSSQKCLQCRAPLLLLMVGLLLFCCFSIFYFFFFLFVLAFRSTIPDLWAKQEQIGVEIISYSWKIRFGKIGYLFFRDFHLRSKIRDLQHKALTGKYSQKL